VTLPKSVVPAEMTLPDRFMDTPEFSVNELTVAVPVELKGQILGDRHVLAVGAGGNVGRCRR